MGLNPLTKLTVLAASARLLIRRLDIRQMNRCCNVAIVSQLQGEQLGKFLK